MTQKSLWRLKSRAVILQVIADNPDADPAKLRMLVSQAYPFGERRYHPYRIWLSEVKRLLGSKERPQPTSVRYMWFRTAGKS